MVERIENVASDRLFIRWSLARNRCAMQLSGAQKSQIPQDFCPSATSPKCRTRLAMRQ